MITITGKIQAIIKLTIIDRTVIIDLGEFMQYILSVTEINKYLREIIAKDLILSNLLVKGELSNFKCHSSGHMYFTLKDEKSLIRCVMFRSYARNLKFVPENGMRVIIKGYVSVYERDGQYQLYAEEIQPDGIGSLHIAFEQLKMKLEEEGLFDHSKKKSLPLLPEAIGIITSITGSVIKDILNVLDRRYKNVNLKIYPVRVQGDAAAKQISKAIKKFNELANVDVIILARGGGSLEELWAFNEEIVARSIYQSRIPIVSAVGHETDYTISDFAADVRAPTPSAAAEIVMPEKKVVKEKLYNLKARLESSLLKKIGLNRIKLENIINSTVFRQPFNRINQERMRLDILFKDLNSTMSGYRDKYKNRTTLLIQKLNTLSPLNILARGYGIVQKEEDSTLVKSVEDINIEDKLKIRISDGLIRCTVDDKSKV